MSRRSRRLAVESLESRRVLSGQPWFEISEQQPGGNSFGIVLGDLDGDDDLDALIGCSTFGFGGFCDDNAVWVNDGQGQFNKGWSDTTSNVVAVTLGDLDSDGDLDALIGRGAAPSGSYSDKVWMNDGNGNFTDSGQSLGRGNTFDVDLGDVDNDGDLDAVLANVAGSSSVWLNDGLGGFTDSGFMLGSGNTFSVALGDLDGDDDLDAFLGQGFNSSTDKMYLNDGHGNFSDSRQRLGRGWANAVQLEDLDDDGDLDAFVANGDQRGTNQPNEVWLNDGLGNFTDSGQDLGRSLSRWAELGDLDGDGDMDAFVGNGVSTAGQPNKLWLNDGTGNFSDSGLSLGRSGTVGLSLGDIDADRDLDVLFGQLRGENEVWFNVQLVAGDANRDGVVDFADFVVLADNFGQPGDWSEGDFDLDGTIGFSDFVLLAENFGYPKSAPIPFTNFANYRRISADGIIYGGNPLAAVNPLDETSAPWTWYTEAVHEPVPFWPVFDGSITWFDQAIPDDPPTFLPDGRVLFVFETITTIEARDEPRGEVVGTMTLRATEPQTFSADINPDRLIVDETSGMGLIRLWTGDNSELAPTPVSYVVENETGTFADDPYEFVGEQSVSYNAILAFPLISGLTSADSLQSTLADGPSRVLGAVGEWVWSGQYEIVPEPLQTGDAV